MSPRSSLIMQTRPCWRAPIAASELPAMQWQARPDRGRCGMGCHAGRCAGRPAPAPWASTASGSSRARARRPAGCFPAASPPLRAGRFQQALSAHQLAGVALASRGELDTVALGAQHLVTAKRIRARPTAAGGTPKRSLRSAAVGRSPSSRSASSASFNRSSSSACSRVRRCAQRCHSRPRPGAKSRASTKRALATSTIAGPRRRPVVGA